MLRSMGQSMNSTDPVVIEAAKERLLQQKPLVKTYTSDHYDQLLASGEVILAHGWGGRWRVPWRNVHPFATWCRRKGRPFGPIVWWC